MASQCSSIFRAAAAEEAARIFNETMSDSLAIEVTDGGRCVRLQRDQNDPRTWPAGTDSCWRRSLEHNSQMKGTLCDLAYVVEEGEEWAAETDDGAHRNGGVRYFRLGAGAEPMRTSEAHYSRLAG